jgi:hypothetical protein
MRILRLYIHLIIQGPSGNDLESAVDDFHRIKTRANAFRRYARLRFADAMGVHIDGSKDAAGVIDVVLRHARSPLIRVLHARTLIADFARRYIVIMAGPIRRLTPHLVGILQYAAVVLDERRRPVWCAHRRF